MKLATIRTAGGTRAVRADQDRAVEIPGVTDVGALLADGTWRDWAAAATGPTHELDGLNFAPLIPRPDKIIGIGHNYRSHILEMGRELPEHPALFAMFPAALVGAHDPIDLPSASERMDWEAELGVVIGRPVRSASAGDAATAIAGYTVVNDVSARDWQFHTTQFLAGKTFEHTTPLGPWLVTADDPSTAGRAAFEIRCEVDGEQVQHANTGDLLFDPCALVSYISTIITLLPGDVISTGTPGGVGHARQPQRYLQAGSRLVTHIEGIGECANTCRAEGAT